CMQSLEFPMYSF
nr:immunoglobulin light chain junction region [Macaca mulatta]MOW14866.1 immunoglobulin light chain junction region [Macaca mulatta]